MTSKRDVEIPAGNVSLPGDLTLPSEVSGVVIFAHGSGSSRRSPRNRLVAETISDAGLGTLLFDLLTPQEEFDRSNVFDIPLLATRLLAATEWAQEETRRGPALGYFGASTGAAAALWAAADLGTRPWSREGAGRTWRSPASPRSRRRRSSSWARTTGRSWN